MSEEPSNPVEIHEEYGGTLQEPIVVGSQEQGGADDQGMHAFDIQTGAGNAEEQFFDNQGGEQHQHQENQGYDQGFDDFGNNYQGQPQDQGYNYQGDQNAAQGGGNFDDDFFAQPQSASGPVQHSPQKQQFGTSSQVPAYGGYGGGMAMYGENYDPEEEERQERLRRSEQERMRKLDEKAQVEREKKQEKIANAARELAKWHSEREQNIEKRKQINKQNQELTKNPNESDEYKNSWDKVTANIALKEGEYPGTKDVTRFRQALLNKKLDAGKGINPELV